MSGFCLWCRWKEKLLEIKIKMLFLWGFFLGGFLTLHCLQYSGYLQIQSATGFNSLYNNLYERDLVYLVSLNTSKFIFIQSSQTGDGQCWKWANLSTTMLCCSSACCFAAPIPKFTMSAVSFSYGLSIRQQYSMKKSRSWDLASIRLLTNVLLSLLYESTLKKREKTREKWTSDLGIWPCA